MLVGRRVARAREHSSARFSFDFAARAFTFLRGILKPVRSYVEAERQVKIELESQSYASRLEWRLTSCERLNYWITNTSSLSGWFSFASLTWYSAKNAP